jgi:hypothetical protein
MTQGAVTGDMTSGSSGRSNGSGTQKGSSSHKATGSGTTGSSQ